MIAGVPGTGIGGLYYVLLAMWMPLREVVLLLRRRAPKRRWKPIAVQVALAAGVVAALYAEFWAFERGVHYISTNAPHSWATQTITRHGLSVAPAVAAAPFIVLAAMIASLHVLKLFTADRPTDLPAKGHAG